MIEIFDFEKDNGIASFYDSHITLNKPLLRHCDDTYRVRVGNDKDAKKLYLFLLNKDRALSGEFNESTLIKPSFSKTYFRLCSKQLMDYIFSDYGFKVEKNVPLKFKAYFDDVKKAIVIDMEEMLA